MTDRCHWVYDQEVPGGKFLVPGCMNRAMNGDDADCHCAGDAETVDDQLEAIRRRMTKLERHTQEPKP